MSETDETKGRCRMEMTAAYGARGFKPNDSDLVTADAIDRLAADVAAVKAKVDAVSPEDVKHFVDSEKAWVALVTEQRDAAIRERDEWREEARLAVINRDEARAEVERLRGELAARPAVNSPGISDSSPADPPPAAQAAGWLTERERHVLSSMLSERPCDWSLHWAEDVQPVFRSILARAGSPPVVEVPALSDLSVAARVEAQCYRDAMDKAGVKWKEVGRE